MGNRAGVPVPLVGHTKWIGCAPVGARIRPQRTGDHMHDALYFRCIVLRCTLSFILRHTHTPRPFATYMGNESPVTAGGQPDRRTVQSQREIRESFHYNFAKAGEHSQTTVPWHDQAEKLPEQTRPDRHTIEHGQPNRCPRPPSCPNGLHSEGKLSPIQPTEHGFSFDNGCFPGVCFTR